MPIEAAATTAQPKYRLIAVGLALAVALSVASAPPAAASPVVNERAAQSRQATLEYWTAQRLRKADPRELALPGLGEAAGRSSEPLRVGAFLSDSERKAPRVRPARSASGVYEVADYDVPPNTVNGKVFARDRSGTYACSATAVAARNESVIFTAGHCLRTLRFGWARRFIFIPSYRDRGGPFGVWAATTLVIPGPWARENPNYDFGAVVLARQNGTPLQSATGAVTLAPNQPAQQDYRAFGYPYNYFDGERMMACDSPLVARARTGRRGPRPMGISCGMGVGSSGGGWLVQDQTLHSLTTFKVNRRPDLAFGPYFGRAASKLLRRAGRQ
jgi:V8-like Glu-specific endopeptidase